MGQGQAGKRSGGTKKHGRSKVKCGKYSMLGQRDKNKVKKVKKMLVETKQFDKLEKVKGVKHFDEVQKKIKL